MDKFKFLEHTADIKFQAQGKSLEEAFENSALAMFGAMSDKKINPKIKKKIKVNGKDLENLIYNFLEELIFLLDSKNFFVSRTRVKIEEPVNITYFVHGTTTDNEKDISSGWKDVNLSEIGIKQSKDLPTKINEKFDVVFCSDLKRAIDSAKLSFGSKYKIIPDKRLRECNYGKFNGRPSKIVEPLQEKSINKKFQEGESYEDVKNRVLNFLEFLKKNYPGKKVAIVSHKAPQLAFDVLLKGKTWKEAFKEDWRKKKKWQPGWDYQTDFKLEAELIGDNAKDYEIKIDVKAVTYNEMFIKKVKNKWVAQVVLDV